MVIGVLQFEIAVHGATSLKDKRRVVSSIKDRLHREHQVSVAEVDLQDRREVGVLGLTLCGSDVSYVQSVLDRILDKLKHGRDFVLNDHKVEILTGH